MLLAITQGFNSFSNVGIIHDGVYVASRHANFITDGQTFQCLDCGRWSDSLSVLNAVDCDEDANDGKTLEELHVGS